VLRHGELRREHYQVHLQGKYSLLYVCQANQSVKVIPSGALYGEPVV